MSAFRDGPSTDQFSSLVLAGNCTWSDLADVGLSEELLAAIEHAPKGQVVGWGIPFTVGDSIVALMEDPVTIGWEPIQAGWLVFLHTSDLRAVEPGADGFYSPMRGGGQLAEHAADYVIQYADGSEIYVPVRRRHQVGTFDRRWGENCFEAVAQHKPSPVRASHEQLGPGWGWTQTRVNARDFGEWMNWLWAWENPRPDVEIVGVRFEPVCGALIVSGMSAGRASAHPLRWLPRRKACLTLPQDETFAPQLDEHGLLTQVQLDMGQVISASLRLIYPADTWVRSYNNQIPTVSEQEVLVEYTAHPDACFHLSGGSNQRVSDLGKGAGRRRFSLCHRRNDV